MYYWVNKPDIIQLSVERGATALPAHNENVMSKSKAKLELCQDMLTLLIRLVIYDWNLCS
jgi:hypothetical protein